MCTLTAYDANRNVTPFCFAIFPSETAENWEFFLRLIFEIFPHFRLLLSDGSKGLQSVEFLFQQYGTTRVQFR